MPNWQGLDIVNDFVAFAHRWCVLLLLVGSIYHNCCIEFCIALRCAFLRHCCHLLVESAQNCRNKNAYASSKRLKRAINTTQYFSRTQLQNANKYYPRALLGLTETCYTHRLILTTKPRTVSRSRQFDLKIRLTNKYIL